MSSTGASGDCRDTHLVQGKLQTMLLGCGNLSLFPIARARSFWEAYEGALQC